MGHPFQVQRGHHCRAHDVTSHGFPFRYYTVDAHAHAAFAIQSAGLMKRILMVAYHFPPLRGSSGIQRTLKFVKYLPEFGWEPIVLTAHPRAYEQTGEDQLLDIPPGVRVCRAFALDTARHLSIGKRYPGVLARPDRWKLWWLGAVPAGLRIARQFAPHVLWSTYPIATAHAVGSTLQRITKLPWVADFRDPMAQEGYPEDPAQWKSFERIEKRTVAAAKYCVFTTNGAADLYRGRYPNRSAAMTVIENGYDEELFAAIERPSRATKTGPCVLLHSGIVYPSERDPTHLLAALRSLQVSGRLSAKEMVIRFRAPVHGELIRNLAAKFGVAGMVEIAEPLPYREALREMVEVDGLLVMQAANCNEQIPAKLYEYLRAGRPILGLADPAGDTAKALRSCGVSSIAALEDEVAIARSLAQFLGELESGRASFPDAEAVRRASRRERTAELARLLDLAAA